MYCDEPHNIQTKQLQNGVSTGRLPKFDRKKILNTTIYVTFFLVGHRGKTLHPSNIYYVQELLKVCL